MEDDWDLYAVVRSCSTTTASTSTSTSTSTATATTSVSSSAATGCQNLTSFEQDCNFTLFKDPFEPRRSELVEDLHQLWKPFFHNKRQMFPISPLSVLQDLPSHQKQQQEIKQLIPPQKQQLFSIVNGSKPSTTSHHPGPRSKKRKNHSKKVCHVAAEGLSSDMWSWRKYGQKPIKGSPYPRGYYRCSTSKGCMARKQVERNKSDPGMFIVTYTGDHSHPMPTHRNSLAGSTRHKPTSDDPKPTTDDHSPPPEKMETDFAEVEEDDDFFAGLEDFAGDCLPENPWVGKIKAATTAAGGG